MGRVQWKLCIRRQQESFRQTRNRALDVIKYLESKDEDCILVTHGKTEYREGTEYKKTAG